MYKCWDVNEKYTEPSFLCYALTIVEPLTVLVKL